MYTLIDQPVDRLHNGSRFLLWAMRGWIHAMERRQCPPTALAGGFSGMGLLPALSDFHIMMALLNRDALVKIAFAPMAYPHVAEDEALLLALWRDLSESRPDTARETLRLLLEEESLPQTEAAMRACADKFTAAGLHPYGLSTETMKEMK